MSEWEKKRDLAADEMTVVCWCAGPTCSGCEKTSIALFKKGADWAREYFQASVGDWAYSECVKDGLMLAIKWQPDYARELALEREKAKALVVSLRTLRNEVKGTLSAHEIAIRYDHGNSNWACLEMAIAKAEEALNAYEGKTEGNGDE